MKLLGRATFYYYFAWVALYACAHADAFAGVRVALWDGTPDLSHPQLRNAFEATWQDEERRCNNGWDDDENGFVDDCWGWDAYDDQPLWVGLPRPYLFSRIAPTGALDLLQQKFKGVNPQLAQRIRDVGGSAAIEELALLAHATHVAGLIVKGNPKVEIVPVRVIPSGGGSTARADDFSQSLNLSDPKFWDLAKARLLDAEWRRFQRAIEFSALHHARIVNGSFGADAQSLAQVLRRWAFETGRELTDATALKMARELIEEMGSRAKQEIDLHPDTLYVFAAGNGGVSLDQQPVFPANIQSSNVLVVTSAKAPLFGPVQLSRFSNFSSTQVHLAGSGELVRSWVPSRWIRPQFELAVSGTSAVVPQVVAVASLLLEKNPSLSGNEMKQLLIEGSSSYASLSSVVLGGRYFSADRVLDWALKKRN